MSTTGDRELVSSAGHSKCLFVKDHMRGQVAGSRGRQKVIHRRSKKATVQAGKRLVMSSGRSGSKLITGNAKGIVNEAGQNYHTQED
jgi:hypothetical protein